MGPRVRAGEPTITRAKIAGGAPAPFFFLVALVVPYRTSIKQDVDSGPTTAPAAAASTTPAPALAQPLPETTQGFLYGRINVAGGGSYEGRLRGGGGREEAFWGDYFNGAKHANPWLGHVPPGQLPRERHAVEILGIKIREKEVPAAVNRLFMARFGDIGRIEAHGKEVRVTLKSGTAVDLDRFAASDFDDDVRVWDRKRGVVDLDSLRIRPSEVRPTPRVGAAPNRLHGTVRTRQGDFTGFVQWDREEGVGADALDGRGADGAEVSVRFETIRSIARRSRDSSPVTLLDGREVVLSGGQDVSHDNRGIYVDDGRYGRVLVSWDAFERVDFTPGGSGPAYGDFPPGRPLRGSVTTRDGRRPPRRLRSAPPRRENTQTAAGAAAGG